MTPLAHKNILDSSLDSSVEKPKSCSFGRCFTKALGIFGQVAKIAILAFAVLPVGAQLSQTALYMNPGQMLTRAGTASCGTNELFFTQEKCHELATSFFSEFLLSDTNPLKFTDTEQNSHHEKGIARNVKLATQIQTSFRFFIPQDRFKNYEKALNYAQWAFIDDLTVFSQGPEKIIAFIKTLHSILVAHEKGDKGEYRRSNKVINPYHHYDNAELEWQDKNLSQDEVALLQRTNYALKDTHQFSKLTKHELDCWKKVVHLPISGCLIESEMNNFIEQFCLRMQRGGNYIDHASFFHTELTRISPFYTGVGRLARLMTNVILIIGEHVPVVFADHREYTKSIREGTFTQYLVRELASTKATPLQLDDPIYRQVIDESRVMNPGKTLQNLGREATANGCTIKMDQDRYFNYQRAIYYVRQHNLAQLTPEQLIKLIKETHILLTQNLEQDEPYSLGQYRKSYMIVDGVGDPYKLIARIQEYFHGQQYKEFFDSYNNVLRDVTHLGRLTKREKELWFEIAHIPCSPDEIKLQMTAFARGLTEQLKAPTMGTMELAGFVHMEFARIWAYQDANGRLARLFMNEILHIHAKPFINFRSEDEYLRTVHSALNDYKIFSRYLLTQV